MSVLECVDNMEIQEDIESLTAEFPFVSEFQDQTVLVTGATGLLGSQIVRVLAAFNRLKDTGIRILAYVRSEEKAKAMFAHLIERGDVELVIGDINQPMPKMEEIHYMIHAASATSSKYFVTHPVETIKTAINGTIHLLEFAREQENLKGIVYLSSLEVYGTPEKGKEHIQESDYGYIDPTNIRSSYSEGKRMVECICCSYASEYGLPVKIARLSQTFGPGVAYADGRVFAEFARCVIEKKNIVLHTQGNTVRTYCYIKDAVAALLFILLKGESGEAYNVTNQETAISIREMAEMVCRELADDQMEVKIEIPENVATFGYNPEMVICLDTKKLETLGWKAQTDLETMFRRMIPGMKKQK